jgi:hypothetical protein
VTKETTAEILIVGAAAAFLAWLWHNNQQAGAGSGLQAGFTLPSSQATPLPGADLFNIPAPVPGYDPSISLQPWNLPPNTFQFAVGQPSSCQCGATSQQNSTFGGQSDMASWLASVLPSDLSSTSSEWY